MIPCTLKRNVRGWGELSITWRITLGGMPDSSLLLEGKSVRLSKLSKVKWYSNTSEYMKVHIIELRIMI